MDKKIKAMAMLAISPYDSAAMRAAGWTAVDLRAAGWTPAVMIEGGLTPINLSAAGWTPSALRASGWTPAAMIVAGWTPGDLRAAGWTPAAMRAAGWTAGDMIAVGWTPAAMRSAGWTPGDLRAAGWTAGDLRAAGWTAGDLRAAGYKNKDFEEFNAIPKLKKPYTRLWNNIQMKKVCHDQSAFGPSDWDGKRNLCKTPMCTAGHLVHMAGKIGYELKEKYGFAGAARLIHAKAHSNFPPQNFGSIPQKFAEAYIEFMAEREKAGDKD